MARSPEPSSRQRIVSALTTIIQQGRFVILGVVIAALVAVILYAVYTEVATKRADAATRAVEAIQKTYEDWSTETDASKKATLEKAIVVQTDVILRKYPRTYAAQRSLLMRGDLAYGNKDWKSAVSYYTRLADRFPTSYLALVALTNGAAADEQQGNTAGAIELDTRILTYKGLAPEIPSAIFSLGRLYEEQGDKKNAQVYYNKLVDQYPDSGWTKLARDRIIALSLSTEGK